MNPMARRAPHATLALLLVGTALLAACASESRMPPAPVVPEALRPPADQQLILRLRAVGVQIYTCQASQGDSRHFDWVLKAPDAQLFDSSGVAVVRHFAGPTWEHKDGSSVVAELTAKDQGPDAMAIPWLLLRAKSNSGKGILSRVQSIQRIDTVGGKAPAGGCGAELAGSEARMQYTAEYLFFGARH